jgi:hypothetical protein
MLREGPSALAQSRRAGAGLKGDEDRATRSAAEDARAHGRFALPKPWPQMTEEEREVFIHESYVALARRAQS